MREKREKDGVGRCGWRGRVAVGNDKEVSGRERWGRMEEKDCGGVGYGRVGRCGREWCM